MYTISDIVTKEVTMDRQQLVNQVEDTAHCCRLAGMKVEINNLLPYVSVYLSEGQTYFFQGEEASDLLKEVPDYLNPEDYILWSAQGW
jgi:hypothetical protein